MLKSNEPFKSLVTQGMVLKDGSKMSKSKGNTVDPNNLIQKYGADTVRLFVIFAAPIENSLEWSDHGVEGSFKFLNKLWGIGFKIKNYNKDIDNYSLDDEKKLKIISNKAIAKVTDDYGKRLSLNTIVSTCMELLNSLIDAMKKNNIRYNVVHDVYKSLILLLNPITPHICSELATQLNILEINNEVSWPKIDQDFLKDDTNQLLFK